jgi:hypothetical protein
MKSITFTLVSGMEVTLFLSKNSNLVLCKSKANDRCTLIDGLHNNGGWEIAKPYEAVRKELNLLFDEMRYG